MWRGSYDQQSAYRDAALWASDKGQANADLVFSILEFPAEISRGFLAVFPVESVQALELQEDSTWLSLPDLMAAVIDSQLLEALLTGVQLTSFTQIPTSPW